MEEALIELPTMGQVSLRDVNSEARTPCSPSDQGNRASGITPIPGTRAFPPLPSRQASGFPESP